MRKIKKFFVTLVASGLFLAPTVAAEDRRAKDWSGNYYCTPKHSAGIRFDSETGAWKSTIFRIGKNFLISIRYQQTDPQPDRFGDFYMVSMTEEGSSTNSPCRNNAMKDSWLVYVGPNGRSQCASSFTRYRFNLGTGRYLSWYAVGYLDGDDPGNTPAIDGGVCTKLQ